MGGLEEFAKYAFNKSHATCYSWVAYQTAYLKAHYPAELMAANLTNNKSDITKITKFMAECKHIGVAVLGPDVNESEQILRSTRMAPSDSAWPASKEWGECRGCHCERAGEKRPI